MSVRTRAFEKVEPGGTAVFDITITDEDQEPTIPTSLSYTVKDSTGDIVDFRDNVPMTGLAASMVLTLTGDDLPAGQELTVYFSGMYTSTLGENVALKGRFTFEVEEE